MEGSYLAYMERLNDEKGSVYEYGTMYYCDRRKE